MARALTVSASEAIAVWSWASSGEGAADWPVDGAVTPKSWALSATRARPNSVDIRESINWAALSCSFFCSADMMRYAGPTLTMRYSRLTLTMRYAQRTLMMRYSSQTLMMRYLKPTLTMRYSGLTLTMRYSGADLDDKVLEPDLEDGVLGEAVLDDEELGDAVDGRRES